jgi:hypothetical protein
VKPLLNRSKRTLPKVAATAAHPIVDSCTRLRIYLIAANEDVRDMPDVCQALARSVEKVGRFHGELLLVA